MSRAAAAAAAASAPSSSADADARRCLARRLCSACKRHTRPASASWRVAGRAHAREHRAKVPMAARA
eukprot:scaffold4753_cov266-Prasinococcus_capsulatus_cf.AAC.5